MKRFFKLSFCIVLILAVALFSLTACSGDDIETMEIGTYENDGFQYSINKIVNANGDTIDHYAKLIKYTGDDEVLTVPSQVYYPELSENINITSIGGLAFYNLGVKNITLSEGITTIDGFAFGYSEIMRIVIPSTIESIGDWAFVNCVALREVEILAEVSPELGIYVFKYYDADGSKDYEIDPLLEIKVPELSSYQTDDVLNNWIEYQDNLVEV